MRRKNILSAIIMTLILTIASTIPIYAGDVENPEIEDDLEDEIVDYLDIISAWFYEKQDQPEYLFIGLKIKEISDIQQKQHLTVHWEYDGIECAVGLHIGYDEAGFSYTAGWGHGFWFQEHYEEVEGEYNEETGIIEFKIPKEIIKNPQKGEVLTNTFALTFVRFGFIGRLGFDRVFLHVLLQLLTGYVTSDVGPDEGYGKDYTIKY